MHVFIITQYFPPEIGAAASRWGDFSEILAKKEYKITVLCEAPHYPEDQYYKGYSNSWSAIEKKSKYLTIIRSKAYAGNRKTFLKKITHYLIFMFSAILNFRKVKNYDILIISTPPLFTGVIGLFAKKFYKKDYWLDIRDLWPDSAQQLGQLKRGIIYKLGKNLEQKIYTNSQGFIFPVPGFKSYLSSFSKDISTKPMIELMNGVSQKFVKNAQKFHSTSRQNFTVLYSGNMGIAQDLETIIKAAKLLKDYNVIFKFIGNGVCKKDIQSLAQPLSDKIFFYNAIKRKKLIKEIKDSSVCLVPLKDRKLFEEAIPSKMFEYMACERPIIVGIRGAAKKIVENSNAGIAIEPEDPLMLSEAILSYLNNEKKCQVHGENGMIYVTRYLSKENLILNAIKKIRNEQKKL